jgi:hypothetical protein
MQLMDFNARYYSPTLGRFIQTDTIIPDLTNSQAWNRYSYSYNNPVNFIDPSGHWPEWPPPLPDPFIPMVKALENLMRNIINTPPIREPRAPQPTSNDVTDWVAERISENANSNIAAEISENLCLNPADFVVGISIWIGAVRTGGVWDYKNDIRRSRIADTEGNIIMGGYQTNFQAITNYTYGSTAASVGIPQWMAEAGAGLFQLVDNAKENRGGPSTYGDDPFDNYWIQAGYDLWETYGDDGVINSSEITTQINDYLRTHGDPPGPLSLGKYIE